MISAIRQAGIIPFFHNPIPGWSIQELTKPGCWFSDEEDGGCLGPWDWKIDAIRQGDILYGKFLSNKAAFATPRWYGHLMNWRRSLPRMRMAVGGDFESNNRTDLLARYLSAPLLSEIRESQCLESARIKDVLTAKVPQEIRMKVGGAMAKHLCPTVRKVACDNILQYLEMGTWVVVGDFERVYRGANLEYKGWQRSTLTTPEELLEDEPPGCSPAESLEMLVDHIVSITGCPSPDTVRRFLTAHT